MKLVILTVGTRGDVQPYVALGMGLTRRGHEVTLATSAEFKPFVEGHQLRFAPLAGSSRAVMEGQQMISRNPIKTVKAIYDASAPLMKQYFADSEAACEGADLILWGFFGTPGYHIAEKMKIPTAGLFLQPWSKTGEFPNPGVPMRTLGPWLNRLTYSVAEQALFQMSRPMWEEWRTHRLKLPPMGFWGPFGRIARDKVPYIYGYSQHVVPRPKDWHENLHVAGYWFLDDLNGWQPPQSLLDFLRAGPPPVYIGFGSMITGKEAQATELILEAIRLSGQRAIILSGWGGLGKGESGDHSTYVIESVPHAWLFPQMAAVAHHGGAGTTGAGVRAGVPSIIIPHFADQPFWADRVYRLGAGTKPVPRQQLTAAKLAAAMRQAVTDKAMQDRARQLGEAVRAEDGIGNAVAAIERLIVKQK
jgi:UDP:flavonoid glycosyltransferase YjiC (YdhE family)